MFVRVLNTPLLKYSILKYSTFNELFNNKHRKAKIDIIPELNVISKSHVL